MSAKYTFWAWDQPITKAPLKLTLLQLADNANDDGVSWYSVPKMAMRCGMSDRALQGHIKTLSDMGLLVVRERPGTSRVYHLKYHEAKLNREKTIELTPADSSGVIISTPADSAPLPPQILHPTPADSSGDPNNESNNESNNKKTGDLDDVSLKKTNTLKFDGVRFKETWNCKAEKLGLPKIRSITESVEKGVHRLLKSYHRQCKEIGREPKGNDDLVNGYIEFGYQPTKWAMGENPEGKKYGIETALTQKKIDEILGAE